MSTLELPIPKVKPSHKPELQVILVHCNNAENRGILALKRWCNFHHMEVTIADHNTRLKLESRVLMMTDDILPSVLVPLSIVKELQVCSTIITTSSGDGKWYSSFILLCNFNQGNEGTPQQLLHTALESGNILHREGLISSAEDSSEISKLNARMFEDNNEEQRYEILSQALVRYWYDLDHLIVARYYSHAWLHQYQRLACASLDIDGVPSSRWRDGFDWVRQQSPFGSSFEVRKVKGKLKTAIAALLHSKIPLGSRLQGLEFQVQEHITKLHRHPLTLPGVVRVVGEDLQHGYDTSRTMVGFYYELGYAAKPRQDYLKSLDKYLTIKHPLIFYGEEDICEYVRQRRDPLFTKLVIRPVKEWPLISENFELFEDTSSAYQMAKSPRYALLTNCKTYAVIEAIELNPFNSTHFIWHDPGFYRHGYMAEGLPLEYPIFSRLELQDGKISMPSLTTVASITDEQYNSAGETLIAYVMGGNGTAWYNFHTECVRLLKTKISRGKIYTEQCLHTRIATLRPDLFNLHFSNYAPYNINRFLGMEVDYSEYTPQNPTCRESTPECGENRESSSEVTVTE